MFIFMWNANSEGASLLKEQLGLKGIRHKNSKFVGSPRKTVINWGASELPPEVEKCRVINPSKIVRRASNKLYFFEDMMKDKVGAEIIPQITTDFKEATDWVAKGETVCARTMLRGHSAHGLVIMTKDKPESFTRAPLYTLYIKKSEEYRVHVMNGEVIDVQRKVLPKAKAQELADKGEKPNWFVRNHDNGFIYQRENIKPAPHILTAALETLRIIGLDFGAVDVIMNNKRNKSYVLEVNTAPGMEGQTVTNYAAGFRKHFGV